MISHDIFTGYFFEREKERSRDCLPIKCHLFFSFSAGTGEMAGSRGNTEFMSGKFTATKLIATDLTGHYHMRKY